MDFSSEDSSQIREKGLPLEEINRQLAIFKRGNIDVNLLEAASVKNGISAFSEEEEQEYLAIYRSKKDQLNLLKFVPASGAATRMFKTFFRFLDNFDPKAESVEDYMERMNNPKLELFMRRMAFLPFFEQVKQQIGNFDQLSEDEQQYQFVKTMLEKTKLGDIPKGLVPFHLYQDHVATAFEEHLREAAAYATSRGTARIHFTIAQEHLQALESEYKRIQNNLEAETGIRFDVSFSFQAPKTDTLAVTQENEPFRDENGKLFFRPGGHGALIENLNKQEADLVFIKNIDNVTIPKHMEVMAENKKILAGKLLQLQEKTFAYLKVLENNNITEQDLDEALRFMQEELNSGHSFDVETAERSEKINFLKRKLNRPIRVCGMVKNEGEPGGGPFWVTDSAGEISLQIVESAQIDFDNYQQAQIAQEATHFNPVDVVCGMKNYKGEAFFLPDFVDQNTSFISEKTHHGKSLKALEHPGLWNGGMANWISIFVEVPIETFNPVKTVADLLKPSHQVNRFG